MNATGQGGHNQQGKGNMNTIDSLLGRNSGGGGAQGDDNTLANNPAGMLFQEQDVVFIDPNI
jgi:hypothetical protein